ncbi:MAG: aldehyde dehydrogenase family protein [Candidatus Thermoplasmatota archaeon]|nr:aldehyde dehydrogenase family protein [Candidatus Thermoplasmatota archaeon]
MIVKNKYTGDQFIELKDTNPDDARTTLNRAKKAFKEMKELPSFERYEALLKVSKELESRREEFARIISNEAGKPIKYSRGEARRASVTMLFSAEESKRIYGETIPMDVESRGKNRFAYYNRVPIGPVFAITPFNDPLNLVAHKVGPAIAAGNSIINKPASLTPYSGYMLNEIMNKSGLPENAMQTVIGSGGGEVTNFFLNSEDIKMVTFTGGVEAADRLIKKAGIKKYSMELGSNSPVLVWNDADLDFATDAIVDAAMESQGQNCIHSQRILIHKDVYNDLSKRLVEKVARLKVGDPLDDSTDVGPMIAEGEAVRVEKEVDNAVSHGAEVLVGGKRDGKFYLPTLITNVKHNLGLWHNEIFGPVSILQPVDDFEEAINMANDVPYGLQAGVYTHNLDIAMKSIQKLDFGAVLINDTSDFRVDVMPFGGMKLSGLGREGIRFAIEEMTEIKLAIFRK